MKKLSIIGRDYHTEEHAVGFYNAGDRIKYWGTLGAFWGIGLLHVRPPLLLDTGNRPHPHWRYHWLDANGTIEGAAAGAAVGGGSASLAAALTSIGIPKDGVICCEASLRANKFLLIAHGSAAEVPAGSHAVKGLAARVRLGSRRCNLLSEQLNG
jgi:hypothetical protein